MNIGNLEIGVCDDSPEDLKRIELSLRRGTEKLGREISPYICIRTENRYIETAKIEILVLSFWIGKCRD